MLETTLSGAIKQWYTTARVETPAEDSTQAETQTTEADTQQDQTANDQAADQNNADANATDQVAADQNTADQNNTEQSEAQEPAAPSEYQVVTKDVVKVRDGASTDANELGLLKDGVTLTAYGTEGDWTIVSYSAGANGRAYIKTDNLQTVGQ